MIMYLLSALLCFELFMTINASMDLKLKIIGLYSICGSNTSNVSMATEFHYRAVSIHLGVLYGLHEEQLEDDFHYEAYDVCNNSTILLSRLIDIMLDPKYMKETNSSINTTSIPCIFSFMTEDLTKLSANILTGGNIPMISFNNHQFFPDALSHALYLRRGEPKDRNVGYYEILVKELGYDFPFVISLNETHGTHKYYEQLVELLRNRSCVIYESLKNTSEIDTFIANAKNYEQPHVLIVMSDGESYRKFLFRAIFKRLPLPNLLLPVYQLNRLGKFHKIATATLLHILKSKNNTYPLFGHNLNTQVGEYDYSYVLIEFQVLFNIVQSQLQSDHGTNTLEEHLISSLQLEIPKSQRRPTICTNFTCGPGYERQIQKINRTVWKNRYSFVCVKCKQNHIKSTTGSGSCEPCYGKNISNEYNTRCYVHYRMKSLDFHSKQTIIGLILNSVGILFSLATFLLYIYFRKTPVVRASDTRLSEIQLVACNTLFLFILLSVSLDINKTLCTAKPVCIGLLFSLIIAVTLAKAEKPLTVFLNRKKLTQKDIKLTEAQQYLIICILPITSALMSIISFHYEPVKVIVNTNDETVTKTVYCGTDQHIHVQAGFIFILLVASLIQAYRSRKVPNHYSESMTILLLTFACCVCLGVLFPLYHFQKEPLDRMHIHWITFCVVGLIFMLSSYAKKVVTLVFYPQRNTVQAFRRASTRSMSSSLSRSRSMTLEDKKESSSQLTNLMNDSDE